MNNLVFFSFVFLLLITSVSAFSAEVSPIYSNVLLERGGNASFDLRLNNPDQTQSAEIYSLVSVVFEPKQFELKNGESDLRVIAIPASDLLDSPKDYRFEYQINRQKSGIYKGIMTIKIVSIVDAIKISSEEVYPGDEKINIVLNNTLDIPINNVSIVLKSLFFDDFVLNLEMDPFEEKALELPINKERVKTLSLGEYSINANILIDGKNKVSSGNIVYLESLQVESNESNSGILIRQNIVSKTNIGNVPAEASIIVRKNILTRLFTSFSLEPQDSARKGFYVNYAWSNNLAPGESLVVTTSTNYITPFIAIILLVLIIFLIRIYSLTDLGIRKNVSNVKTKGGEFALKITLHIKARRHVDKIQIVDSLPGMTQIYEKFGRKPDRVDAATRRIFWNIDSLNAGEERVISYIIFSKVRAIGSFELPSALAIYQKQGLTKESRSNKTFFVSETRA